MLKRWANFGLLLLLLTVGGFVLTPLPAAAATAAGPQVAATSKPDILVPPSQGPPVSTLLAARAKSSWPWYVTRAAGMLAAVALVMLLLSGIGLITGYTFRFLEPLTAWATHRAIGIVFGIAGSIHVIALLFDTYVRFSIPDILFPFASGYKMVTLYGVHLGSLYVALGIYAMYATLAIIMASFLWIDKKPHTWKAIHFLAYLVVIFVFFHALYLGTDLISGTLRWLWIGCGIVLAIAILYRLRRARSI